MNKHSPIVFIFVCLLSLYLITIPFATATPALHSWYHRTAYVDLDRLWDSDPNRIPANIDTTSRYLTSLGINTVIFKAWSDASSSDGQINTVYFSNPVLPDRGNGETSMNNLLRYVSKRFTDDGFKVGAQLPLLRYLKPDSQDVIDNQLSYVSIWDPTKKVAEPLTSCSTNLHGCRLSPFDPKNYDFVLALFKGMFQTVPNIHIIHTGNDDILTEFEDCSAAALAAYNAAGVTAKTCEEIMALTGEDAKVIYNIKANRISKFYADLITELRTVGDAAKPGLISTRQFYGRADLSPELFLLPQYSQSFPTAFPYTDILSVLISPYDNGIIQDDGINPSSKSFNWYFKTVVDMIKLYDPNLTRTQILLPTMRTIITTDPTTGVITKTQQAIEPLVLREWIRVLIEDYGVYHLGLAPVRPFSLIPSTSTPLRTLLEKPNNRCIGTNEPDPAWNCPSDAVKLCTWQPATEPTCRDEGSPYAVCVATPTAASCPIVLPCISSVITLTCPSYRCTLNDQAEGCHAVYISQVNAVKFNPQKEFNHFHPADQVQLTWNTQAMSYPTDTTISVAVYYTPYDVSSLGPKQQFIITRSAPGINLSTGALIVKIPDQIRLGRDVGFVITYSNASGRDLSIQTDPTRGRTFTTPFCAEPTAFISTSNTALPFTIQYENNCGGGATCDVFNTGLCQCQNAVHANYIPADAYDMCTRGRCNEYVSCTNSGLCLDDSGPFKCLCPDKWVGSSCEIESYCLQKVRPGWCLNGGHTRRDDEQDVQCNPTCLCTNNWVGSRCEQCSLKCRNGSTQGKTCEKCNCLSGYYGKHCQCRRLDWTITTIELPSQFESLYSSILAAFFPIGSDGSASLIPVRPRFDIVDQGMVGIVKQSILDLLSTDNQYLPPDEDGTTPPFSISPLDLPKPTITNANLFIDRVSVVLTSYPFLLEIQGHINDNCSIDLDINNWDDIMKLWNLWVVNGQFELQNTKLKFDSQSVSFNAHLKLPELKCDGIYTIPPTPDPVPDCEDGDVDCENSKCDPLVDPSCDDGVDPIVQAANTEPATTPFAMMNNKDSQLAATANVEIPTECIPVVIISEMDNYDMNGKKLPNVAQFCGFNVVVFVGIVLFLFGMLI